jgi:hypothetical protein
MVMYPDSKLLLFPDSEWMTVFGDAFQTVFDTIKTMLAMMPEPMDSDDNTEYRANQEEMEEYIYSSDATDLGIRWINTEGVGTPTHYAIGQFTPSGHFIDARHRLLPAADQVIEQARGFRKRSIDTLPPHPLRRKISGCANWSMIDEKVSTKRLQSIGVRDKRENGH